MNECRRCAATLLHCHDTLVRHDDGSVECCDVTCTGDVELHDFVVTCDELACGCVADLEPAMIATRVA
jgi:hypothetical protein